MDDSSLIISFPERNSNLSINKSSQRATNAVIILVSCTTILNSGLYLSLGGKSPINEIVSFNQEGIKSPGKFLSIEVSNSEQNNTVNISYDDILKEKKKEEKMMLINKKIDELIKIENRASFVGMFFGLFIILSNLIIFDLSWGYTLLGSVAGFSLPLYIKIRRWERSRTIANG